MKRYNIIGWMCVGLLLINNSIMAQDNMLSTPEVTISTLFKAMYDGDSTMAKMVFADGATLNSVYTTKDGKQMMNNGNVSEFINAIGSPHDEVWDERIGSLEIKIDGDLAQAWMDYMFFVDDKLSHCGVNAMHLIRKDGQWKIFQIVDTRRKEGCEP